MSDGSKQNRAKFKETIVVRENISLLHDASSFFQPNGVRPGPILVDKEYWKYLASEFGFVCVGGSMLWIIYFISQII
jgi:hypothetical protein